MDLAAAIQATRAGNASPSDLARALAAADPWWVPSTGPGKIARLEIDGVKVQPVFSGISAMEDAVDAGELPAGLSIAPMPPAELLGRSQGVGRLRLDGIDLDLELVRALWAARPVQAALAALGSAGSLRVLKDYTGWWLIYDDHGASQGIALAPDDKDRRLVAVFSAPDTRDAFLERFEIGLAPRVVQVDGARLFEMLADLDVDGIVFDCAGPAPARAFRAELAQRVLEA